MATLTATPTTLQQLERLEERCVQLEDELDRVTGKSWEIRHGVPRTCVKSRNWKSN